MKVVVIGLGSIERNRIRRAIAPIPCTTHAANCVIIGTVKALLTAPPLMVNSYDIAFTAYGRKEFS